MLHREVQGEALTGEADGPAIELRNQEFGMPMLLSEAEGNTEHGVIRQSCTDPARSETLCTSGRPLHRNWEISAMPGAQAPGGVGKAKIRNPTVYVAEKSDTSVVPEKPSNKGPSPAEMVEERDVAKGNTDTSPGHRAGSVARRWGLKVYVKQPEGKRACSSRHCCTTSHRNYWRRAFMRFAAMRRWARTACRGENMKKVFSSG